MTLILWLYEDDPHTQSLRLIKRVTGPARACPIPTQVQALLLEPSSGLRCSEREKARGTSGASLLHACVSPDSDPLAALRLSVAQFLLGQDKEVSAISTQPSNL